MMRMKALPLLFHYSNMVIANHRRATVAPRNEDDLNGYTDVADADSVHY